MLVSFDGRLAFQVKLDQVWVYIMLALILNLTLVSFHRYISVQTKETKKSNSTCVGLLLDV